MTRKPKRPKARLPRGFVDTASDASLRRLEAIEAISSVYRLYGFEPLETPSIEYLDALGKFLPDVDAPDQGVFALRDDDEQWLALRYDHTAPLARYVAQNRNEIVLPYRRYQVGPVYRREKPGPGRFRQFIQCDFDTVGSRSMAADAESCVVMAAGLRAAGVPADQLTIRINNRKILDGILTRAKVGSNDGDPAEVKSHVLRSIDKLDRIGVEGVALLLGPGRMDESGDFTKGVGLSDEQIDPIVGFVSAGIGQSTRSGVLDTLANLVDSEPTGLEGIQELATIDELLSAEGVDSSAAQVDPTVVRGLDYYTGPVFEAVLGASSVEGNHNSTTSQPSSVGSVGGGGRYDQLIKRFTGQEVPATGASIGIDRLLVALDALSQSDQSANTGPVVVTVMDKARLSEYQRMVSELRQAGVAAELYLGNKALGHQLKYADRRRSPLAVIAGSNEFDVDEVVIKNLAYGKQVSLEITDRDEWLTAQDVQQSVPRDHLVASIRQLLNRP